jgi:peptidoglycan L-alanyl-D-glutamate endopeptidase CwlK
MYSFGKRSQENLFECHEDLQIIFNTVIEYYDCAVIEGSRSKELQDKYYHSGKSQVQWPKSKHNTSKEIPLSLAADVVPWPIDWRDKQRFYHFAGFVRGIAEMLLKQKIISHRIRCGADWDSDNDFKDQNFHDLPHFELVDA